MGKLVFVSVMGVCTVNYLIKAHFQINASYLLNAPSRLIKLY